MAIRKGFKFNRAREICDEIGTLQRELLDIHTASDKATVDFHATTGGNDIDLVTAKRGSAGAADAALTDRNSVPMNERFPAMRGPDSGLTPELLNRLNR